VKGTATHRDHAALRVRAKWIIGDTHETMSADATQNDRGVPGSTFHQEEHVQMTLKLSQSIGGDNERLRRP